MQTAGNGWPTLVKKLLSSGQRAGVGHDAEGVHLQAVVVMEAQRLMLNDALVELKAALLQTLAAARMAGVEDRHIVLFRHLVDGGEQRGKVLLGVDVLLAVGRQQNVLALLETQTLVDVGCLDFFPGSGAAPRPSGNRSRRCAPSAGRCRPDNGGHARSKPCSHRR